MSVASSQFSAQTSLGERKVAIVVALEREVHRVVKRWPRRERHLDGRSFTFFENGDAVLVCAGIGREAARQASEAAVALYRPELLISAGFAGALSPGLAAGEWVLPAVVIDARDGSRFETDIHKTSLEKTAARNLVLVSADDVADPERKAVLFRTYSAYAVDMEAAAVAQVAREHRLQFLAVKAVSDESKFEMPPVERFVRADGELDVWGLAGYAGPRFWLWPRLLTLARNSSLASEALCSWLEDGVQWQSLVTPLLNTLPNREVTTR